MDTTIHGDLTEFSLVLAFFIITVIFLAIIWRMAVSLDKVAHKLGEIADELKRLKKD